MFCSSRNTFRNMLAVPVCCKTFKSHFSFRASSASMESPCKTTPSRINDFDGLWKGFGHPIDISFCGPSCGCGPSRPRLIATVRIDQPKAQHRDVAFASRCNLQLQPTAAETLILILPARWGTTNMQRYAKEQNASKFNSEIYQPTSRVAFQHTLKSQEWVIISHSERVFLIASH